MSQTTLSQPIITFEKVNKWFVQFHVLRDIDLTVGSGERIVICGPSGSGKSTLIRCINRWKNIRKAVWSSMGSSSPTTSRRSKRFAGRSVWCFSSSIYFRT